MKNIYALFNTKTNEVLSRGLTSDMVDYELYKNNKVNQEQLKVIKNPLDSELKKTDNGTLIFSNRCSPHFLGCNY